MTDISTAAETAREDHRDRSNGQFGQQHHTEPEAAIAVQPSPVILTGRYTPDVKPPIPYPKDIPAGGHLSAGLEDSDGRVFVTISFGPEVTGDQWGTSISLGGREGAYNEPWNSLTDEETPFDYETDEAILGYLREVCDRIDAEAERAKYAVLDDDLLGDIAARATSTPEPIDHSDEATEARTAARGEKLVNLYGHEDEELIANAADAIADIVRFYASKGGDVDELWEKAEVYARTEEEDAAIRGHTD